ncbi:MAG: potassium transporter TrkG [Planctomycetota bacterium]
MKRGFASFPRLPMTAPVRLRQVLWTASVLALISLCLEYGFDCPPLPVSVLLVVQVFTVGWYVLSQIVEVAAASRPLRALGRCWFDILLIAAAVVILKAKVGATVQGVLTVSTLYVATLQVLLSARFGTGAVRSAAARVERRFRPAQTVVLSFLTIIVIGGLLLALPKAMAPEFRHEEGDYLYKRLLNCMFTSTSATCVTGLVVYDIGRDFTRFGQIVILMLIQVGGLGIMILGSIFGILAGGQMSLRHSLALQDALSEQLLGRVRQMVLFVVASTFACELAGAAVLYTMWPTDLGPPSERAFYSIFHAVSAFCNAGFALPGDNLISYRGAWQVYVSIMPLIVLGGLGFPVLYNVYGVVRTRLTRPRLRIDTPRLTLTRSRLQSRFHPFSLHTKLVVVTTAVLILFPALGLFVFESMDWRGERHRPTEAAALSSAAMADLPPATRAAAALFQSVTPRTAGFNVVPLDPASISTTSAFLTILLMFIGGSPASTAGGAKTVTIAILLLSVHSTMRGRASVEAYGRTIPLSIVRRASMVVILMFGLVSLVTLLLCITERGESLMEILFETTSACSTVGLSTGLTPRLTVAGRVLIMLAMFAGRVGPLTILVALAGRAAPARYEYPEEHPVIG